MQYEEAAVITIDPPVEEALQQTIKTYQEEIRITNVRTVFDTEDSNSDTVILAPELDLEPEIVVIEIN